MCNPEDLLKPTKMMENLVAQMIPADDDDFVLHCETWFPGDDTPGEK